MANGILTRLEKGGSQLKSEPKPLPPIDIVESVEESQLSLKGNPTTYIGNFPK